MQKNRSSVTSKMVNYLVFGVTFLVILKVSWHAQSLNLDAAKTNKTLQWSFKTESLKTPVLPLINSDRSSDIITEDTIVIGRRDLRASAPNSASKQKVNQLRSEKSQVECSLAKNQKIASCDCKLNHSNSDSCRVKY